MEPSSARHALRKGARPGRSSVRSRDGTVKPPRRPDDDWDMEAIGASLRVQAMVMRDVREQVEQIAAAQVRVAAPADVILELSTAAQNLLNLR